MEQETKPNPQKEVGEDQTVHGTPWELEKYKVAPPVKGKDRGLVGAGVGHSSSWEAEETKWTWNQPGPR